MKEYWFDADNKPHDISKMDESYISRCLNDLRNCLELWRGIIPEQLTKEELNDKDNVMSKAWFVLNGIDYINSFCEELKKRKTENNNVKTNFR